MPRRPAVAALTLVALGTVGALAACSSPSGPTPADPTAPSPSSSSSSTTTPAHQHPDLLATDGNDAAAQLRAAAAGDAQPGAEGRPAAHGRGAVRNRRRGPRPGADRPARRRRRPARDLERRRGGSPPRPGTGSRSGARRRPGSACSSPRTRRAARSGTCADRASPPTPSALSQGKAGTAGPNAATVARELTAVGVNVDLAPVADTVAASFAARERPDRRVPARVRQRPRHRRRARGRRAVGGLQGGGVSATLKHFPGLGRVTGNTDLTANGTTDTTTTADDPYLEPFRAGIQAGADLVMVSSAIYSKLDPANRAAFSRPVVTGLLRETLGYGGVVISDDLGGAAAVAGTPAAERATRFVAAGGDIVLTGLPQTVPTMAGALRDKATAEAEFAAQVDAAATRVLDLKAKRGLAAC